jgi:threonine dehydratase
MMNTSLLTLQDIFFARKRIQYIIRRTPLQLDHTLSDDKNRKIHLKLENLQTTGSFKLRGAANKVFTLTEEEKKRGLVTVSSGNHGRALSYVSGQLGIRAVICLSEGCPQGKKDAIARLGGEIIMAGRTQDEAIDFAYELSRKQGLVMVSSFDDLQVIAGQGTIGLEVLEDLPSVDTIITPLSGGSLLSGIAMAVKTTNPKVKIVGVSMDRAPVMIRSLEAGTVITLPEETTIADGLAGGIGNPNKYSFQLVQQLVDETVTVTEEEIGRAMAYMLHEHHLVVEGAGAVGLAAVMHDKVTGLGDNNVVVISGSNVTIPLLMDIYTRFYA